MNKCPICGKILIENPTCAAWNGSLYCGEACCIEAIKADKDICNPFEFTPQERFDMEAETVATADVLGEDIVKVASTMPQTKKHPMTLEQFLRGKHDGALLCVWNELDTGACPADGYAHTMCKHINFMLDKGTMCVVPDKYRHVYLPTLKHYVNAELAARFVKCCLDEASIEPTTQTKMEGF